MSYQGDVRWEKLRLRIFERDKFSCRVCMGDDGKLLIYSRTAFKNGEPWSHPVDAFKTMCPDCYEVETEEREGYERQLLNALETDFLAADIHQLAGAFAYMGQYGMPHIPDVTMSALCWAIEDKHVMGEIVDAYFKWLGANNSKSSKKAEYTENVIRFPNTD